VAEGVSSKYRAPALAVLRGGSHGRMGRWERTDKKEGGSKRVNQLAKRGSTRRTMGKDKSQGAKQQQRQQTRPVQLGVVVVVAQCGLRSDYPMFAAS